MRQGETERVGRWVWICRLAGLAWVLGVVVPYGLSKPQNDDFPQLYMAGVVAAERAWPGLYRHGVRGKPEGDVKPAKTEAQAQRVGRPSYEQLRAERGVPRMNPTIYPPPVGFLMLPLGWLSFGGARVVFAVVSGLCAWGGGLQAGWMYRRLVGRRSVVEGWLVLTVCLSPLLVRGMRVMNISLILGVLVGGAMLAVMNHRRVGSAAAVCVAGVFRASSGPLVLLLVGLGRWRSLAWIGAGTAAVVALMVGVMGWGPVVEFVGRGLPAALQPYELAANQSAGAFAVRMGWLARDPARWVSGLGVILLLAMGLRLLTLRRGVEARPAAVVGAGWAMMLVWFAFSPIFWSHYHLMTTAWWGFLAWSLREAAGGIGAGGPGRWLGWGVLVVVGLAWLSVGVPLVVAGGGRYLSAEPWRSHVLLGSLVLAGWSWWQVERLARQAEAGVAEAARGGAGGSDRG